MASDRVAPELASVDDLAPLAALLAVAFAADAMIRWPMADV